MTVKQLYDHISDRVPTSLSCEWDNDGLMLSPDSSRPVRRVLCTLDVTDEAVDYAQENGFDLILSHHPLIFRPLRAVNGEDHVSRKVLRLLAAGISVISLHTRADAVLDGVNDRLADMLGLERVTLFGEAGEMLGRLGYLPEPMSLPDFCRMVKELLGAPTVLAADAGREVLCVALCGGEGKDYIRAACEAGADTYLSGRLGYHPMTDGPEMGINLVEAGHYYTETHITGFFAELVSDILPEAETEEFASNIILCM